MKKFSKKVWVIGILSSILLGACTSQGNKADKMQTTMMSESAGTANNMESRERMDGKEMSGQKEMSDQKEMTDDKMVEKMDMMQMEEDALTDMEGNTVYLSSLQGKKVYAKFWASWCSICLAGLEDLDKLSSEDKDFEVVTIVAPKERGEKSKEEFMEWFQTLGYKNIKVLFDEDGSVLRKYGVVAYPTSLYINADGSNTEVKVGHYANDLIKDAMATLN